MTEKTPHPSRDHETIRTMRSKHPHQVELEWPENMPRPNLKAVFAKYAPGASWCDFRGYRTFGFVDEPTARAMCEEYGGERRVYEGEDGYYA